MCCRNFFFVTFLTIFFNHGEMADPSSRIFGGEDATIEEFPHMAYIRHRKDGYVCSGAILSKDHIATTASCVMEYVTSPFHDVSVITGTDSLLHGGNINRILYTSIHPEFFRYYNRSIRYDYAVITLCDPIALNNKNQKPIALPSNYVRDGDEAVVTGWGLTEDLRKPDILQKLVTKVYSGKQCAYLEGIPDFTDDSRICASLNTTKGICENDSGAPLVVRGKLVGLASLRHECGSGRKDMYANIFLVVDFFKGEINPEICS